MADQTPDNPDATGEKPAPKPRARRTPAKTAPAKATPKVASEPAATSPAATKPEPKPVTAAKAPPKPRSPKRATAARAAKSPTARAKKVATDATGKVGGIWGAAAIAGGVVAAAGAAAALLTLRGSTPKDKPAGKPDQGAKQADGTDSSKSFEAGIADEGTVPNA